jgi:hypothetical protein
MKSWARAVGRGAVTYVGFGLVAALICIPIAAERAVESVGFEDRLGTLPVHISLAHNGMSTLDTGILGQLYWDRTGAAGFGALVRATGPPEAGGSLASYVSPDFVQTNVQFVNDPGEVARVYGREFESELSRSFWWYELWIAILGGALLTAVFRARSPIPSGITGRLRRIVVGVIVVLVATGLSAVVAGQLFTSWDGNNEIETAYPMPGVERLRFSSPEALEVARQIQPFIEKNTNRIRERTARYEAAAIASLQAELPEHVDALAPRAGERIVIAEADPQGSLVGTQVRTELYPLLQDQLGEDAFAIRTVSGDVTSNGTVAEDGFVEDEASASPDIPLVAVKGDHDTNVTVEQFDEYDILNPEFEAADVEELRVVAGNDPAFKALFGGLVVNESGITETQLGENLREEVDPDDPVIVLLHQPRSVAGFVGVDTVGDLDDAIGRETVPWDDGIPDLPPGVINYGHLHDPAPPRVIWNTDGEEVTWTVVNQLGTSGGVEENPTFNRFSTPFSAPLKTLSVQLQYLHLDTGLQTGYASIDIATDGTVTITDRIDLGLPGDEADNE